MAYFYGKEALTSPVAKMAGTGALANQGAAPDGNGCERRCIEAYQNCIRAPRGEGPSCEEIRQRCLEECRGENKPTPTPDANCPDGKGPEYEGCQCGKGWATLTGKCPPGYIFVRKADKSDYDLGYKEGAIGQCECQKWINENWDKRQKGNLGEYSYPSGMQDIMNLLLNRAKGFYGYDPASLDAMFGRGFENIRGAQPGVQEGLNRRLASQGMLGTGVALDRANELSWATERSVNDLMRDIMIKNEEQKRSDTQLASSLLGTGMGYEQLREAINAGRRGESNAALMALLSLLQLFGSQTS